MIHKVLFLDSVHEVLEQMLTDRGIICLHDYTTGKEKLDLNDIDGVVIRSRIRLDADFLGKWNDLKFIARSGSGLENIDLDFCREKGIEVFNSPEGNSTAVAEHAIGMLLGLFNHLRRADRQVREGEWRREENRGLELEGKTVAIIGYGVMGSAFARRLKGFDCKVMAYDKFKKDFNSAEVTEVGMEHIFREADVVSLHIPLNDETRYMVNAEWLSGFEKPVYLINTSRGQIAKIADVVSAIQAGRLLGACLDVLEYEETSFEKIDLDHPEFRLLASMENVVLSPHVAGWTHESYVKLSRILGEKIIKHFRI